MKTPSQAPRAHQRGFALIVTITLMLLMAVIVISFLTLSTATVRSSTQSSYQAIARANARMALTLALGQLQKETGPDRSTTARAAITGSSTHSQWLGAWQTGVGQESSTPVWLVSGHDPDPSVPLDDSQSLILAENSVNTSYEETLRAPAVVTDTDQQQGRYAYWISDEGSLARVDMGTETPPTSVAQRANRAQAPAEPGLTYFDPTNEGAWQAFLTADPGTTPSMSTVALAAGDGSAFTKAQLPEYYQFDLTTGGYGLPVDVHRGGMKADLSLLFDSTQEGNSAMIRAHIGANPSPTGAAGGAAFNFENRISDPDRFFLTSIPHSVSKPTGPNWGILWNYAKSWENVSNHRAPITGALPNPRTDLRHENWIPYNHHDGVSGAWDEDFQHYNHVIHPVLSTVQMTIRLRSVEGGTGSAEDPPLGTYYHPILEIKPVIGLWNPYNVAITSKSYLINWAIPPYLRFAHQKANGSGYMDVQEIWLREYWRTGNENGLTLPTENSGGGGYFNLSTPSISFAPGEIKYFSINSQVPLANSHSSNSMIQSWGEAGGFYMPIVRSTTHPDYPKQAAGTQVRVPAGHDIWFGGINLQDTQHDGTAKQWGDGTRARFASTGSIADTAASCWIALKAGDLHLQRITNLWNGGHDETMNANGTGYFVPQPVQHSTYTAPQAVRRWPIEYVANGNVGHLATWRFNTRTASEAIRSTDGAPDNQGLR
ncbi:MAG: type IV pilus modification PilV family protein, partial [Verrucomicrobiales bacterium]